MTVTASSRTMHYPSAAACAASAAPAPSTAAPACKAPAPGGAPAATARPYPVNLDVSGRAVLVVGGGPVAARKAAGLLAAGAQVTVVAPQAVTGIADDTRIDWHARPYRSGDLDGRWLAVTAADDPEVNRAVAADGEQARVWVNSADDPANCSFTLPAVARSGDVQVAVSTGGRSPALAAWLRSRFQHQIDDGLADLLELLAETRAEARGLHGTSEIGGWAEALDDGLADLVRAGRADAARSRLRRHLGIIPSSADPLPPPAGSAASRSTTRSEPQAAPEESP